MSSEERQQTMDFIVRTLANLSVKMDKSKEESEAFRLEQEAAHKRAIERMDRLDLENAKTDAKIRENALQIAQLGEEIRDFKEACIELADASRNTVRRLERLDDQSRR